uniref:Integrase-type domain-containing protein n=1 Tax=Caenorhabditis japonica TaxID=281687 RepID=A0A8R1ID80_CAEJA
MPARLCSKNDEDMTVSVSNWRNEPVLIKKNQIAGVVSREWKVCERKEEKVVNMLDIDKKPSLKGEWKKKNMGRLLNETGEIPSGMFRRSISEFSEVFAIEDSELTQTGIGECKVELEKDPIHKIKYPGVGDRVLIRIPAEKLRSKNPKLANEWQGPYRVLKTTDNSAEVAPIIERDNLGAEPAEKLRSKNPKLANEWQGPYRVLKTTDNSAEVAPIIGNGKSLWVPWEHIRVVPKEVPEVKIETKAKRGRRAMQKDVVNQVHIWEKDNFSVENMKFNKSTRRWKKYEALVKGNRPAVRMFFGSGPNSKMETAEPDSKRLKMK